jgi:glycerophosphoryl diester phosphodiesterase
MWPYPQVLAHRGGGALAPENTMAALRCGLDHGFHAVEFDVMLSRDSVPVVMHDPALGRTVRGSGQVFEHDAMELIMLDAGSWFGPAFRDETVPLFTQVVEFCKKNGIWMNIELKPAPGFDAETGQVVGKLARAMFAPDIGADDLRRLPLFSSFSVAALEAVRASAPELPRALLVDRLPPDWEAQVRRLECVAVHANHKHLKADQAAAIKAAGLGLMCYTVNTVERVGELRAWGVDAICTDRIDLMGPDFE